MNIPELDELYALYRADLYRYLCRLTRDSAAAEDLLSETFLRALKGAVTFRGESGVKTWLFTIARNAWCESLRRQHPTVSTDELVTAQYLADDTLHTHTETRALLHRVRELLDGYGDRPPGHCTAAGARVQLRRDCRAAGHHRKLRPSD